jgi:hypothetical protein
MFTFAITWLSVALAMISKSVTTASNLPMPLMMLPFLGSGRHGRIPVGAEAVQPMKITRIA